VGDSRAYLLRGGRLRQLSKDHSWASALQAGSEEPWIGRHVITRALGLKREVEVDVFPPLKLQAGDRVLLCSDGLTDPLPEEEIAQVSSRYAPQKAAEALVRAANARGGPDNVSVMLLQIDGGVREGIRAAIARLGGRDDGAGLVEDEDWLGSPVFVAVVVLIVLILLALGFVLGLLLFGG
jgi:protein phosphatase